MTISKKLNDKVKAVLEKIGYRKKLRATWFKDYGYRFEVQLKYFISDFEYDLKTHDWKRTPATLHIDLAFVHVWYTVEQSKVLPKLTRKAFKDKEKMAKMLEGIVEVR